MRRVRLTTLINTDSFSYEGLVLTAIKMTFPGSPAVVEDFDVSLTYYDVDVACVTIASTDELMDAIEQYCEETYLQITADVKRRKDRPIPAPMSPSHVASDPLCSKFSPTYCPKTQPSRSHHVQLQSVVESILSVLATAVVALQTHMKEATNGHAAAASASYAEAAPTAASPQATVTVTEEILKDEVDKVPKEGAANITINNCSAFKEDVDNNSLNDDPTSEVGVDNNTLNDGSVSKEDETTSPELLPFIHGRHTCDSCLGTPIVGIRYHAVNLPDYDLCAHCKDNYKGDEIHFEPAELDRDIHFQDRWHRKRAAKLATRDAFDRCSHRTPHEQSTGNYSGHYSNYTRVHACNRGRHGFHRGRNVGGQPVVNGMDVALKEAIRRSLHDVQKEQERFDLQNSKKKAPVESDKSDGATTSCDVVAVETDIESVASVTEIASSSSVIEKVKEATCVPAVEEVKVATSVAVEEPMQEVAAVAVEKLEVMFCSGRDSSFSSEAAGNGEAAEALGLTLDQCADAIDAMMTEVERDMHHTCDVSVDTSESASDCSDDEHLVEADILFEPEFEDAVEDEEYGHTIVDGDDRHDRDEVSTQASDDWQVVDEDAQLANDEMIARAARFLGSALFESELSRSDAATHVDLSNSNLSTASSALTYAPTILSEPSPAQLSRWALQLSQLQDLGFYDNAGHVEILERFSAANIGSDFDDEVTVTRVINELLKSEN